MDYKEDYLDRLLPTYGPVTGETAEQYNDRLLLIEEEWRDRNPPAIAMKTALVIAAAIGESDYGKDGYCKKKERENSDELDGLIDEMVYSLNKLVDIYAWKRASDEYIKKDCKLVNRRDGKKFDLAEAKKFLNTEFNNSSRRLLDACNCLWRYLKKIVNIQDNQQIADVNVIKLLQEEFQGTALASLAEKLSDLRKMLKNAVYENVDSHKKSR